MNKDEILNFALSESDEFDDKKIIYDEVYACYQYRRDNKKETIESFDFERNAGEYIEKLVDRICRYDFRIESFNRFLIHNPDRYINAPDEVDRLGEFWLCAKYIKPYLMGKLKPRPDLVQTEDNLFPRLYVNNMACQDGKGTDETIRRLSYAVSQAHIRYGNDFYILQFDFQKFYDNMAHDKINELFKELPRCAYISAVNVIDSYRSTPDMPECYAYDMFSDGIYGMPKGTLISQWAGVMLVDPVDRLLAGCEGCFFVMSYMDDGLAFFRTKYQARDALKKAEAYLIKHKVGIRFNPKKTAYYPMTRGINYCGFRYSVMDDHTVIKRLLTGKKKEMYGKFKNIQYDYKYGYIDAQKAAAKYRGMFAHMDRGNTFRLRRYCQNRFYLTHNKD